LKLPLLLVQNTSLFCRPFCIGALERLAELTICTICESKVSEPIFSAIIKDLFPLIVPAITVSSAFFIQWNGFRNHRFVDSGPSVIFPSTGIFHLALREANHPFDIMNRNNFIASFND
jgi:hypothetical protein